VRWNDSRIIGAGAVQATLARDVIAGLDNAGTRDKGQLATRADGAASYLHRQGTSGRVLRKRRRKNQDQ
jgi:hypothetical protein